MQSMLPQINQAKQAMNMLRNAGNPQALLNQMLQGNPQMQKVNQLISQAGGDPEKAFYALAREKGIDPQEIIKMLQ